MSVCNLVSRKMKIRHRPTLHHKLPKDLKTDLSSTPLHLLVDFRVQIPHVDRRLLVPLEDVGDATRAHGHRGPAHAHAAHQEGHG